MEKTDEIKRKIITSMVAIILLILTIFGITYAYFVSKVKGNTNDKSIDVSTGKLELTYADGNGTVNAEKIEPGVVVKGKIFTVKNTGVSKVNSYEVVLERLQNDLKYYDDLTYELTCVSDKGTCNGNSDTFPIYESEIVRNEIDVDETQTYTLTLTYHETYVDQSKDMAKEVFAKVNIRDSENKFEKFNIIGNSTGLGVLVNDEDSRFNKKYKIDINATTKNLSPNVTLTYSLYVSEPLRCVNSTCDYIDLIQRKVVRKISNDNNTLSIKTEPTYEKIQVIDYNKLLIDKTITVTDSFTNGTIETELMNRNN